VAINELDAAFNSANNCAMRKFMQANFGVKPVVGSLDKVAVWARALTVAEVANLAK
jgi:hypothetical protein